MGNPVLASGHDHFTCFVVNLNFEENYIEKCRISSPQSIRDNFNRAIMFARVGIICHMHR